MVSVIVRTARLGREVISIQLTLQLYIVDLLSKMAAKGWTPLVGKWKGARMIAANVVAVFVLLRNAAWQTQSVGGKCFAIRERRRKFCVVLVPLFVSSPAVGLALCQLPCLWLNAGTSRIAHCKTQGMCSKQTESLFAFGSRTQESSSCTGILPFVFEISLSREGGRRRPPCFHMPANTGPSSVWWL